MKKRSGNFKKIPSSFEVEDGAIGYVIDDQVIQLLNSMGEIICDTKDWATGDKRDLQNLFSLLKQEFTHLNVERKPVEQDKDEWCLTVTVTEECLTCETEVINGGTWGYCDECWDERVRWLGQEEGE